MINVKELKKTISEMEMQVKKGKKDRTETVIKKRGK